MTRAARLIGLGLAAWLGGTATVAADQLAWYAAARFIGSFAMVDEISNTSTGADSGFAVNETDATDLVAAPGLALGYWLGPEIKIPLRVELEYDLRYRFDYDNSPFTFVGAAPQKGLQSNIQTHTVLFNFYYDIQTDSRFIPFVGVGLGYAYTSADTEVTNETTGVTTSEDTTTDNFAWSGRIGTFYQLSRHWGIELAYQYIDLGKVEIGPFADGVALEIDDYTSHDFILGVVYRF